MLRTGCEKSSRPLAYGLYLLSGDKVKSSITKIINKLGVLITLLAIPGISHSWVSGSDLRISSIVMWESSEVHPLYFKASNDMWCYVPAGEKNLHSLILTLYASGKASDIHCYDLAEEKMGGVPAGHKLHRIITK